MISSSKIPSINTQKEQLLLLLESNTATASNEFIEQALDGIKASYISQVHHATITHIASGTKAGKWKTYVGHGKHRKEIVRCTDTELRQALYDYYTSQATEEVTYNSVFNQYLTYLADQRNRKAKTLETYRSLYKRFIPQTFGSKPISEISEDDVLALVSDQIAKLHPKMDALKKYVQQLKAVFAFSVTKKLRATNPATCIDLYCYYKDCDITPKRIDNTSFSDKQIALLRAESCRNITNPRALIILLAIETGMRAAELVALHREDIRSDGIWVHRQMVYEPLAMTGRQYCEVPYTKDQRTHPTGGRVIPWEISPNLQQIVSLALAIPGESIYLFHDPQCSEAIKKDGYEQYLRRTCKKLGFTITKNHGFRMHFNEVCIAHGMSPAERALLLGHTIETNERFYSHSDSRLMPSIIQKMHTSNDSDIHQFFTDQVALQLSA